MHTYLCSSAGSVSAEFYNCNTMLWDDNRGRMTAFFIDMSNALSYVEIDLNTFRITPLHSYNSSYSMINNYAYHPKKYVSFFSSVLTLFIFSLLI